MYRRLLQAVIDRRRATAEAEARNYHVSEVAVRRAMPQTRARRMIKLAKLYESSPGQDICNETVLVMNSSPRGELKCPVIFASNVG